MGLLEEVFFLFTTAFVGGLTLVLGYFAVSQIAGLSQFSGLSVTPAVISALTAMDMAIVVGTVFLAISSVVLAYFIPSHPAFFFTYILTLILVLLTAPQFSNVYAQIANISILNPYFNNFPLTALLIGNLPTWCLVFSTVLAIVSYGKGFRQTIQGL